MIVLFWNVRHGLKDVFEIFKGFESVFLRRLNEGVDCRASFCSFWSTAEEPVLSAYDKGLYTAFRPVIGEFKSPIKIEGLKVGSLSQRVVQGFTKCGFRQCTGRGRPCKECL